ncbi:hypothetical protein CsSME_00040083 [Camellia sinensis var. sinensis]
MYGGASEVVRCFGSLTLELLQWVCLEFGSEQRCPTMELVMAVGFESEKQCLVAVSFESEKQCSVAVIFESEKQWVLNRRFESEKQCSDRGSGDGCSNGGLGRLGW